MEQLATVWKALGTRRQVIVVLATVAMFAAVLALANFAARPSMALLYSGLDGKQSGEVLGALDQSGVVYEVRGTAIYVDAQRRDELRMSLAAEGLPSDGGSGYELLDSMSGFGTTSQMFDAAYQRAREGELSRTITAMPTIRTARVHIADARSQGLRGASHAAASVVVTTTGGMSVQQARALRYLVASAVPGMAPQDVSVIDSDAGLVDDTSDATAPGADQRAEALRRNVERLLEARVGYGNVVVEVALEAVTEREAITERRLDPEGRVAISTDTQESANSSSDSAAGEVTVASNLPTGDASGASGRAQSKNSETRERTNFEVSETTRELVRVPGAIRRLTVAVLVDGVPAQDGGTAKVPRSEEELAALRDLVAAAVGFDEQRGDVLTVKSMSFEPVMPGIAAPESSLLETLSLDLMALIQVAVLATVSLVLGLFVLRPMFTVRAVGPRVLPAPSRSEAAPALTGTIEDDRPGAATGSTLASDRNAVAGRTTAEGSADPVARLRQLISERQDETVEILRGWMEEPEEKAL